MRFPPPHDVRVTWVAPLATQGLFSWPPRPLARPGPLGPFLSRPTPAARGTILKFVCSNEERAARRVCVGGRGAFRGLVRGPGRYAPAPERDSKGN